MQHTHHHLLAASTELLTDPSIGHAVATHSLRRVALREGLNDLTMAQRPQRGGLDLYPTAYQGSTLVDDQQHIRSTGFRDILLYFRFAFHASIATSATALHGINADFNYCVVADAVGLDASLRFDSHRAMLEHERSHGHISLGSIGREQLLGNDASHDLEIGILPTAIAQDDRYLAGGLHLGELGCQRISAHDICGAWRPTSRSVLGRSLIRIGHRCCSHCRCR